MRTRERKSQKNYTTGYYKYATRAVIEEKFKSGMIMSAFSFDDDNDDIFVAYGRTF